MVWDMEETNEVNSPYLIVPVIWTNSPMMDPQKDINSTCIPVYSLLPHRN